MSKNKKVPLELNPAVREHPSYEEGVNAFTSFYDIDDCEYEWHTEERMAWLCGWYDARMRDKLGHVFEKHGLEWP